MNEFLNLLSNGITLDFKLSESFKEILALLQRKQALRVRKGRYFLCKDFCIGRLEFVRNGGGFVIPLLKEKSPHWRIKREFLRGAQHGDIVLAQTLEQHKSTKKTRDSTKHSAKIIHILESREQNVLCYLEKYPSNCMAVSIPNEIPYKIKASQKSLKTLPANTILRLNPQNGEILEILGTLEDPKMDEILTLKLYNKSETFSLAAELEAASFKEVRLNHFKERVDFTHLPFCVIDPVNAKDHDDAVYFDAQNSTLYVAIADVSYYVKENSALDQEAQRRCFSIYFPHKAIPMLPRALSENLCSLKENHLRLAMVWKMRLHRRTKVILESALFEAVIKVRQKLSYDEVDDFFTQGRSRNLKPVVRTMLQDLKELAQQLHKKRVQNGFDFVNDASVMELDYNLELKGLKAEPRTLSHQIVEECMLLANKQSATLQTQKTAQNDTHLKLGIYRVHGAPKRERIRELFAELKLLKLWQKRIPQDFHRAICAVQTKARELGIEAEVDKLIIKAMQQAFYASHNIGHFGLGFKEYSHFTSPIRRYSDLVLHRILKAKIRLQKSKLESLPQICDQVSQREREVAKIELEFKDRKFARFLQKRIGQSYFGIITGSRKQGLVTLIESPLQGARVICLKGSGVKYQKVRIQIIDVNVATARIYGRILESFNEGFGVENEQMVQYILDKKHKNKQSKAHSAQMSVKRLARKIAKDSKHKRQKKHFVSKHKRGARGV